MFLEPARITLSWRSRQRLRELRALWPDGHTSLWPYSGRLGAFGPAVSLRAALAGVRGPLVFHCRGPEATIQAARVAARRGGRVVVDARGATDHEAALRLRDQCASEETIQRARATHLAQEREAVARADAVLAVSQVLAERYRGWLDSQTKPVAVVPCCVDRPMFSPSDRLAKRAELGIRDDELLVVHISTEARWEAFDDVIALFREIERLRKSRLLFLTPLPPATVLAALPSGDPLRTGRVVIAACSAEVPAYLSAADVGVLLRRPDPAFETGSPVKFAEYLAAGLAVVVSDGIGTTADIVIGRRLGSVLPRQPDEAARGAAAAAIVDLCRNDAGGVRRRALGTCEELYVWNRYADVIAQAYGLDVEARRGAAHQATKACAESPAS